MLRLRIVFERFHPPAIIAPNFIPPSYLSSPSFRSPNLDSTITHSPSHHLNTFSCVDLASPCEYFFLLFSLHNCILITTPCVRLAYNRRRFCSFLYSLSRFTGPPPAFPHPHLPFPPTPSPLFTTSFKAVSFQSDSVPICLFLFRRPPPCTPSPMIFPLPWLFYINLQDRPDAC